MKFNVKCKQNKMWKLEEFRILGWNLAFIIFFCVPKKLRYFLSRHLPGAILKYRYKRKISNIEYR